MFGFTKARYESMTLSEYHELRMHYCGNCMELRTEFGLPYGLINSWDTRLISLLIDSQLEDSTERGFTRCPARLWLMKQPSLVSALANRYASAVMIVLASEKLRDDQDDNDSLFAFLGSHLIENQLVKARLFLGELEFPFQSVDELRVRQSQIEASRDKMSLESVTSPTADAMSLLFSHISIVADAAHNTAALGEVGRCLGAIVVILDACHDYKCDAKNKSFNAVAATLSTKQLLLPLDSDEYELIWTFVLAQLGGIRDSLEQVTLHRNRSLIENILHKGLYDTAKAACSLLKSVDYSIRSWTCPKCCATMETRFCPVCGVSSLSADRAESREK